MYAAKQLTRQNIRSGFPFFKTFSVEDKERINFYVDAIRIPSCEYSFTNLFSWQGIQQLSWTIYQGRLLIYDGIAKCTFMPIGKELSPDELSLLSMDLKNIGLSPNFNFVSEGYIEKYPEIKNYYIVKQERDHAEYIYDVDHLCLLQGKKLHKKRNLIAQFKRSHPQFEVQNLEGGIRRAALEFSRKLVENIAQPSQTILNELDAIEKAFEFFDELELEGLALMVEDKLAAFSVFSELGSDTFNVHFEKSDIGFKGAAQVINQETALFLRDRCRYLNREQDLGIKGLRQAKMSYGPAKLLTPSSLIFSPSN